MVEKWKSLFFGTCLIIYIIISGMDPAMPLIVGDSSYRLDSSDAKFVDVIHTSIYYLGVYKPTGHADFYPNGGGPLQPGCGVEIGNWLLDNYPKCSSIL